jgi:hypothetical protein
LRIEHQLEANYGIGLTQQRCSRAVTGRNSSPSRGSKTKRSHSDDLYGSGDTQGEKLPGMRIRRASTTLLPLLLPFLVVACDTSESIPRSFYRLQGRPGFAIWPEDRPEDGREACRDRKDSEPWRTDPDAVAQRFVTTVLSWPQGDNDDQYDPDTRGLPTKVMSDPAMPQWALGIVLMMRRLDDCFFVAQVTPREDGGPAMISFAKGNGGAWVVRWLSEGLGVVEFGYGRDVKRVTLGRGEEARIAVPSGDGLGHFLAYASKQPNENVIGHPIGSSRALSR